MTIWSSAVLMPCCLHHLIAVGVHIVLLAVCATSGMEYELANATLNHDKLWTQWSVIVAMLCTCH